MNSGTGGATLAADDVASVWYQRVKLTDGTEDSTTAILAGGGVEAGALRVTIASDSTGVLSVDDNGGALTVDNAGTFAVQVDGAALTALQLIDNAVSGAGFNITQLGGAAVPIGAGLEATALRVTLATDSTGVVSVDDNGGALTVDNAGTFAVQATLDAETTKVIGTVNMAAGQTIAVTNAGTFATQATLQTGSNAIGKLAANSGVDIGDVDVTSISAGSNLIGDVGIQGRTTGGLSSYYDGDLDEAAIAVKASAATLYGITAFNTTAAPLFLQLFNVAQGSVTVGTTAPTEQYVIPGNADSDGAGFTYSIPQGVAYGTALTAACTTNSAGSGAPGVGACIINIHYK